MDEYSHFFEVKLDLFDGPIDLLLHLVKSNELSIEKVSLAQVTAQYLHCIDMLKAYDLEVAGEYLVIAATLISIKASVLLNEPVALVEDEEGNLVDPHEELLRRLREAAVYKDGAGALERMPLLGVDVFSAPQDFDGIDELPTRFAPHSAYLLGKAFKKALEKAGQQQELFITLEAVSIAERMMGILDSLKAGAAPMEFWKLIPDLTSKMSIVGTFVALLELSKRQVIQIRQDESLGEITIGLVSGDVNISDMSSEFDTDSEVTETAIANN